MKYRSKIFCRLRRRWNVKVVGLVVVTTLVAAIVGCASTPLIPSGAVPIKQPAQRFDDAGFSVIPPPGEGWYGMQIGGMITFGKAFSRTHTFVTSIAVYRMEKQYKTLEDFLRFVEQAKSKATDSSRFAVLLSDFKLDPRLGPDCLEYHRRVEDHGSPNAPGKTLILEVFGVACLHPDDPHRAVDLEYSERSLEGNITSSVYTEGEAFLSSLQFVPLEKQDH